MGGQRDRGKYNKRGGRGGGRSFQATSAEEIELRDTRIAAFDQARARRRDDAEEEEEGGSETKAASGVASLSLGENLNRGGGAGEKSAAKSGGGEENGKREMTRREREQAEKERKAADYRRRHELGLTDEFKRDMEKLAEVKKRRDEAQKSADEEKEVTDAILKEKEEEEKERRDIEIATGAKEREEKKKKKKKKKDGEPGEDIPKLDKIAIKKMKPTKLKEELKTRSCDTQGNAKILLKRLLDFEANR